MQDPGVEYVQAYAGGDSTSNTGRMFANLKPRGQRDASADEIIARLRPKLAQVPGATLYLQAIQDLRIGGRAAASQYQYTLRGDDVRELQDWAPRVMERLRRVPSIVDVNSDLQIKGLEASLAIDRATASRLGITPKAIDDTLYDAFGQRQVSTIYTPLNQYHVILEMDPKFLQGPEGLDAVRVRSSDGSLVPLSAFARYEPSTAPLQVNHQGLFPSVTISFALAPGARARRGGRRDPGRRGRGRACPPRSAAASRARRRPFRPRSPTSRS